MPTSCRWHWVKGRHEDDENQIKGILPLVHLKSILFGSFLVSLPYFNYGGLCADNIEVRDLLIKEAISIAKQQDVEHIELRHVEEIHNGLQARTEKVSMRLKLALDPTELWRGFTSNLRRKIRKPTKEGMFTKVGRLEELDNFYSIEDFVELFP